MPVGDRERLVEAVAWIVTNVIGNDATRDPIPSILRPLIAERMVTDPKQGWPSIEEADRYLNQWRWS